MAKSEQPTRNLKTFNAYVDENGQDANTASNEVENPKELNRVLASKPDGESETARIASGRTLDDATAATEAEVPAETIDRISNPHIAAGETPLDRATAALGRDKR